MQFLSQGVVLFDFIYLFIFLLITAADGISRPVTATPTLLTMPGGDEEEARVEEAVKNEARRRRSVCEYTETSQELFQLGKERSFQSHLNHRCMA